MTRGLLASAVLLVLLPGGAVVGAPAQQRECDLDRVVRGYWCARCKKILDRKDYKESKHTLCGTPISKTEICVKYAYNACHKGPQTSPYTCCGKRATKTEIKALVTLKCPGCGAAGEKFKAACKEAACKKERHRIARYCSRAGATPHITPLKKPRR